MKFHFLLYFFLLSNFTAAFWRVSTKVEDPNLICPNKAFHCCPDLSTWSDKSPCDYPQPVKNPGKCYKRKHWACCVEDGTATCTNGSKKNFGWRGGNGAKYFGIGEGMMPQDRRDPRLGEQ